MHRGSHPPFSCHSSGNVLLPRLPYAGYGMDLLHLRYKNFLCATFSVAFLHFSACEEMHFCPEFVFPARFTHIDFFFLASDFDRANSCPICRRL